MANTLEENLRVFILADTTVKNIIGDRCSYNHVPQTSDVPYVFFQQTGTSDDDGISDSAGLPTRFQYTVECWDIDPFQAKTLGRRIQTILHKYRGALGDSSVQAIFAASQDDDYVPRGIQDDSGFHGSFLSVELVNPT